MELTGTLAPQGALGVATTSINGQIITVQAPAPLSAQDFLQPLNQIAVPAQLPPGVVITATAASNLRLQTPTPFGFDFHWIREAVKGVLQGATGLRVDAAGDAVATATIAGSFTATLQRDDVGAEPWLRLTLSRASDATLQGTAKASITTNVDVALPATVDELLQAIFGVHPLQWLRTTLGEIGSVRWKQVANSCGLPASALESLLETIQQLGTRSESVLWKAVAQPGALSDLLPWIHWIANECTDLAALKLRVQLALDQNPAFANTPAGLWIEASTGVALAHLDAQDAWDRLHQSAVLLDRLTNTESLGSNATVILKLLTRLYRSAAREVDQTDPGDWALQRMQQVLGGIVTPLSRISSIASWFPLRDRIYAAAKSALAKKLPAELSLLLEAATSDIALADASFPMTPTGLARLHAVLAGDLTALYGPTDPNIRLRRGLLTHHLRRTRHLELHLPFLDRRSWEDGLDALSSAEVLCDSAGRLITWSTNARDLHRLSNECHSSLIFSGAFSSRDSGPINDNFTLCFEDTRQVHAGGRHEAWLRVLETYGLPRPVLSPTPTQATLTISLPGSFVECWTTAPHSRDREYFPTMCRISRAMQAAVRQWLPALYFADIDRFRTPSVAHPLLAYQYSVPYTGIKRSELSYDFMSPETLARALSSAGPGLRRALPGIQKMLVEAGLADLADSYDPKYTSRILAQVQAQRRNFNALLAGDTYFIEEMVRLADTSRELRAMCAINPAKAIRNLSRYSSQMVKALHDHLRRLYAGDDFVALGSLLLVEATAALAGRTAGAISIAATLKLENEGGAQVYTNEAARRQL